MKKMIALSILIFVFGCETHNKYTLQHYNNWLNSPDIPTFGDPNFDETDDNNDIFLKHSNVYIPSNPFFRDMLKEIQEDIDKAEIKRRLFDIENRIRYIEDIRLRRKIEDDYWRSCGYDPGYRLNY